MVEMNRIHNKKVPLIAELFLCLYQADAVFVQHDEAAFV